MTSQKLCILQVGDKLKKDIFKVAGKTLNSRLIVGTGKYKSFSETAKAVKASGADMANVIHWPTTTSSGSQFDLATDLGAIEEFIEDDGEVAMLIIDPVTAFCGGKFDNDSVTSVRHITTKLNDLAEGTGVAVIALSHLTKSDANPSQEEPSEILHLQDPGRRHG